MSAEPSTPVSRSVISGTITSRISSVSHASAASSDILTATSSEIAASASSEISAASSSIVSSIEPTQSLPVFSTLPPFVATPTTTSSAAIGIPNFTITFAALLFIMLMFKRVY